MDSKQLKSLKSSNDELAGFIVRLTNFYEGLSTDIDTELSKLRSHLSGNADFALAKVSISKINQLFMLEPANVKSLTQQWVRQLESDVKAFQRYIDDDALSKRALGLATELSRPLASITQILPLYEKLIKCYQSGLNPDKPKPKTNTIVATSEAPKACETNPELKQDLIDEMTQLLQAYARVNPDDISIHALLDRIDDCLTHEDLLSSCLLLLRIMVNESLSEATTTGKVINRFTKALDEIDSDVSASIQKSESQHKARQLRQKSLLNVLEDMEDVLENEESIDQLKEQAQQYLSQMTKSLVSGEQAEREEQAGLMDLLQSMQEQLSTLQKQTSSYRRKLAEQRANMYTDPLTKIPNRMAYNERANKEWQKCQQLNLPMSIAVIDVDHFKRINDKYGHAAGDKTLRAIARYLKTQLIANEFIARWGGEEFILLAPNLSESALLSRLDKLRTGLAKLPFKFKQEKLTVTVSIGATQCKQGEALDNAFERADRCLYQAKEGGRNKVVV